MKFKNLLYILGFAGIVASCEVTDIDPLDAVTDATYWSSVSDLQLYANSFYTNLSEPAVDKDNTSDNCITTNYSAFLFNESTIPSTASGAGWTWTNIRACNFFLNRYQQVKGSESEINVYVAEVRFFRALDYFGKIKKFGDVPWYEKDLQTTDTEELYKARDSRDFILGKIIEDLEFAINWLPEYGKAIEGRLTKDAARTQLARVCLHEGTFKKYHNLTGSPTSNDLLRKAADVAEVIMNTKNYSIVKGTDAGAGQKPFEGYPLYYCNQFVQEDLIANKECILPRIYQDGILTHQTGRQAGGSGTGLSKDFIESFLCDDGLPIGSSSRYQGDDYIETEIKNRDPRLYQIVDNKNRPYLVMNGEQQVNPYTNVDPSAAVTGYPCVKFRSPLPVQAEARKTTFDWFVYRYAEVLLIYAEAKAELGECTQQVLDLTINQLRDRVDMPHLTINPIADPNPIDYGYTISPLLYEIRRERRIELITEGFRLDDVKRWKAGKLFENPKTMLGIRVTDKVISVYPAGVFGGENGRPLIEYNGKTYLRPYLGKSLTEAGRKWSDTDKRYLDPLPTGEILLNPNLTQNPGWK
ncbi:putative outer membrane starch-binding protein [Dysgonomonas alginatilytica]|uniref:Putative outer membrane starch-binding protein n=1 Tax=Dysgonomonas alginatilytica TaxID=1605892 RepID=A0A2V3PQV3_9BACT|nr:RagB/SusD family nutrient uptake outer membrane protein [Dysgonomonas alginatilytica]PXV66757.1 putative outer membrane starch-binding protein [Dysgonomonas alginatilytica]